MKKPQLFLTIDPKADVKNCLNFLKEEKSLIKMFLPSDLQFILQPIFNKQEKNKIANAFTTEAHRQHYQKMKKSLSKIKSSWTKIAPQYYSLCEKIFNHHSWPKGKYHGYATIFCCFPRYLEQRTFFLPTTTGNLPLQIIAHEMIHFIFFDYLKQHYNLTQNSMLAGKPKNFVWVFSEAFNNMLENWKPYADIFHTKGSKYFDPEVNKLASKLKQPWAKKPNLKNLINNYLLK